MLYCVYIVQCWYQQSACWGEEEKRCHSRAANTQNIHLSGPLNVDKMIDGCCEHLHEDAEVTCIALRISHSPAVQGRWSGSVVSSVAGQFLQLDVYRMTQGAELSPPLGSRRNRGNLFSLARLSSHTETVFVLFDCIAPLGSLTFLSPSLLSPPNYLPLSFSFFFFLLSARTFSISTSPLAPPRLRCFLIPSWAPRSLHPSSPPSTVTQE